MLPQLEINLESQRKLMFENNQVAKEKDPRTDYQEFTSLVIL